MILFCIYGEPASKANSRQIVTIKGRPAIIKSKKGRDYENDFIRQIPHDAKQNLEGELSVTLHIYYASERPDLDESIVLDCMQAKFVKATGERRECVRKGVYINDRQVREKHVYHYIDKANPRVIVQVEPRQQEQLFTNKA